MTIEQFERAKTLYENLQSTTDVLERLHHVHDIDLNFVMSDVNFFGPFEHNPLFKDLIHDIKKKIVAEYYRGAKEMIEGWRKELADLVDIDGAAAPIGKNFRYEES